jgi:membrane-bound lytic murein transglycosylase D
MKKIVNVAGLFYACLFSQVAASQTLDSSLFVVPDLLSDNVAFWKKIYTEVSLKEGVLHDRDYPLVIYEVMNCENKSGWSEARLIESRRLRIEKCIDDLKSAPESTWTDEEKTIALAFKAHAPLGALDGAKERIRFQLGQKERFREGVERSAAYIDTIRAILAANGVPADLAYLPHVESSFRTDALSRVGAAGLWQFMRGTGRLFLKINYLIDERRDPLLATVAAARLLKSNYEQLQAWPLAITAYNHGVNGMKRAVEVTGSRDICEIIKKYESPSFQFASKNFYCCFLAASDIAKHPDQYFSGLRPAPRYEFRTVSLPSFMRPSVVCGFLKVPQKTLMDYNPALRPVVFYQQKQIPAGFTIRIPPEGAVPEPQKALAAVPDSLKSETPERSAYYSVRRGDNLVGIASRMGVTVEQLVLENNITAGRRIYAGQVLRIPGATAKGQIAAAAPESAAVAAAPAPAEQKPLAPLAQAEPPEKPAPKPAKAAPKEPTAAAAQPKSPEFIKEVALVNADTLATYTASGKPSLPPAFDASVYELSVEPTEDGATAAIRVSVDETIGHYADWCGVPTYRIRELNRLGRRSEIRLSRRIVIPAEEDILARFVKARLEYHMALEEDFYSRYKVTDVRKHTVRRGEVLWSICNGDEQIPLWLFKKYNKNEDLTTLMPGMTVWIPVIEEKTEQDMALDAGQDIGIYPPYEEPVNRGASSQIKCVP